MRDEAVPATIRRIDAGWQIGAVALSLIGTVIGVVAATGGTVPSPDSPAASATAASPATAVACIAASIVLAGWLATMAVVGQRRPADRRGLVFGVSVAIWAGALIVSDTFVWVAFALFIGVFAVCRPTIALAAVAAMTVAAIGAPLLHGVPLNAGRIAGPTIGAVTASVLALVMLRLARENERRRRLIAELDRTRDELAAAERSAGVADERERLAREIHDTLAQGLSSIVLLLEAADGRLAGAEPAATIESARDYVHRAADAARANLGEARRFVRALAPPEMTGGPLAAALARLEATTLTGAPGAPSEMHVRVEGTPVPLPMPVEVTLLRLAQSALANVARHAAANRVDVTLSFLDGEVSLDVVDDGCGFEPATTARRADGSGYGLPSMTERVAALGGTLSVESAPGEGTAVAARIPVHHGEADADAPGPTRTTGTATGPSAGQEASA